MTKLPLEGVRVVENTQQLAGPYGGMSLGQLGAEVIRVERPQERVPLAVRPKGLNDLNTNKLGVTIDLTQPRGVDDFKKLINVADVFLENNSPGSMERLGLGYSALRKIRPDLIMVSISSLGQTGPFASLRGLGSHAENMLGLTALRGYENDSPTTTGYVLPADAAAGVAVVFGVLAALRHRRSTGRGQFIDLSLSENLLPFIGQEFLDYSMNKRIHQPLGNHHPYLAPHNCYQCRGDDEWINITVTSEEEWRALCDVMGRPDLYSDRRFSDPVCRWDNQRELDAEIERWTRTLDARELMGRLQKAGVAAGALLDEEMCFDDPHLRARGFFQRLTGPEGGTYDYPSGLWKSSEGDPRIRRAPPRLAEHNVFVFQELLGS